MQPQNQNYPYGDYGQPHQGSYPPLYSAQPQAYPPPPTIAGGYAPVSQGFGPAQPQFVNTQPIPGHQGGYAEGWMSAPVSSAANCPGGLQYLTMIDQLLVKQKVELLEAFVGFETANKYTIKNSVGQKVFYAVEDNDCCTRNCCGSMRPFDMKILDNYQNEIIRLHRELRCDTCWFPCCLQYLEVFSPPGSLIGTVEQTWSVCTPQFNIKNESGTTVLKIEGPVCRFGLCGDVEFKVLSKDKSCVVGHISKRWSGLSRELFTDADYFGISFPLDLDVRMKAVMIGACFLIDFMYFEKSGNQENDGCGVF